MYQVYIFRLIESTCAGHKNKSNSRPSVNEASVVRGMPRLRYWSLSCTFTFFLDTWYILCAQDGAPPELGA